MNLGVNPDSSLLKQDDAREDVWMLLRVCFVRQLFTIGVVSYERSSIRLKNSFT